LGCSTGTGKTKNKGVNKVDIVCWFYIIRTKRGVVKNTLLRIAGKLVGIAKDDLTTAEKQIVDILIAESMLRYSSVFNTVEYVKG
jgi:hypothetical protein